VHTADRYILRVLANRWPRRVGIPTLLDISRGREGLRMELGRIGFRVTGITLQDGSLEGMSERLGGVTTSFDAICCRDVLELVEDWAEVVGRIARSLCPGGVFLYSVGSGTPPRLPQLVRRWLASGLGTAGTLERDRSIEAADLAATLRRAELVPREMTAPGGETARTVAPKSVAYVGYSVRRSDPPPPVIRMRWEFTGTAERWIAGRR
jgi:2-polyprenyl-3-methyl-5-hydroxy-6-metoxy-1,4-benzoquinol methylase